MWFSCKTFMDVGIWLCVCFISIYHQFLLGARISIYHQVNYWRPCMLRLSSRHVTYLLRSADDDDLPWPVQGSDDYGDLRECLVQRRRIFRFSVHSYRTCLSSILRFEPSKRRPFPFKTSVFWIPGFYLYYTHSTFRISSTK